MELRSAGEPENLEFLQEAHRCSLVMSRNCSDVITSERSVLIETSESKVLPEMGKARVLTQSQESQGLNSDS